MDGTDVTNDCDISKVKDNDKIKITAVSKQDASKFAIKEFSIVSHEFNSSEYFISEKSTAKDAVANDVTGKVYTGAEIKPTVYLYKKATGEGGTPTKIDSSLYDVTYSNNVNVGTAIVTVKGKGTAVGSVFAGFVINSADFAGISVTAADTNEADVSKYDVTVKFNGNTLKKGTDYTLSFKNEDGTVMSGDAFTAGNYIVVVAPAGNNFTTDSKSKEYSFKVNKKVSSNSGVTVDITGTAFTYTGYKQVPTVTVKKDNKTVTTGYTVTYYNANGVKVTSPTDAGTYKVVVEGTATGLEGTEEGEFTINPVSVQSTKSTNENYVYIADLTEQKYTGKVLRPEFTVYYKATSTSTAKALKSGTDYTVSYSNNINVGTGKATVTFRGNYKGSDLEGTFIISNGTLLTSTNTTISGINSEYDYTGYAIKPTVYVTYKSGYTSKTLTESTTYKTYDYKVSYSSNIAAGTATVTITGEGEYIGTLTKTFKIKYNLANANITLSNSSYNYDGYAKKPTVTVKIGNTTIPSSEYTVKYADNTNTGTASVTVTANTSGNSKNSNTVHFTIKGKVGFIAAEYNEFSTKTTKSNPFAVKIISNSTDAVGYTYASSNPNVAEISTAGIVTTKACGKTVITITTTGGKAYEPASTTVNVTVKPPKGKISSVKSTTAGKMTVTFEKAAAAEKGTVKYQVRYSRDKNFTSGTYKTATFKSTKTEANAKAKKTVKGLKSGYKYYTKVRGYVVLPDGTKVYGKWSAVKSVRIK